MSNFGCLPGKAGGTPHDARQRRLLASVSFGFLVAVILAAVAFYQDRVSEARLRQVRANALQQFSASVGDPLVGALLVAEMGTLPIPTGGFDIDTALAEARLPTAVLRGHLGRVQPL